MASRQKKKQQLWPLGTKVRKHFDGHGDFDGEVKGFDKDKGLYNIEYTDGDTEQFDEREMKRYVLKTISFAAKPAAAKPSKAKSPKKNAARKNDKADEEDTASDTPEDGTASAAEPDDRNERMMREIEDMHQEMEITGYVRGKTGQKRRKVPRNISKMRTQKRRALEKADRAELALLVNEQEGGGNSDDYDGSSDEDDPRAGWKRRKKLRGSMAAMEVDVLEGSMIFHTATARGKKSDAVEEGDDDDDDDDDADGEGEDTADEDEEMSDVDAGKKNKSTRVAAKKPAGRKNKSSDSKATSGKRLKKRRQMYRLRNFQSFKMAQRHGDALAAHAQGNYRLAIHKLKAVAKDAPSAPQVYASLGMVYEDMLKGSKQSYLEKKSSGDPDATALEEPEEKEESGEQDVNEETKEESPDQSSKASPFIPNSFLREQCEIAKKAYGSHHASAVLCKKDFTLWVRSTNCGLGIADLHEEISTLPGISEELCSKHREEKRRWLNESLRDLQMADNLSPPGIDVPAKLAAIHMELGSLSEALTILTDLKNRAGRELRASYKAWLLYADLMLRFGHECTQWNQNVQTTENYMVRRWLRKYSTTFDWQERRMQALSLALGAAAGTKSAEAFLDWIKTRAMTSNGDGGHDDLISEDQNRCNGLSQDSSETNSATAADSARKQFEQEKCLLEKAHAKEIDDFDDMTTKMELIPDSDPENSRLLARELLLQSHQAAVSSLEKEKNQQKCSDTVGDGDGEKTNNGDRDILPMSASVGVVCSIASDLMKQLVRMELYKGARLVGEVVSRYMKERARLADRTLEARRRADEWQNRVINAPFLLDPYEENEVHADEELLYLSDEDTLVDTAGESTLLESLRRGALPPELRILSGLAMVGEGGRNFVASKYLQTIEELDLESLDWLKGDDLEAQFSRQPRWFFFHRTITEKLTKTVAFSLLAETLKKSSKNAEWARHFCPVFFYYLQVLKEKGLIDELVKINRSEMTANTVIRRSQILKTVLGACRLGLDAVEEQQGVTLALGKKNSDLDATSRMQITTTVLDTLLLASSLLWSISRQGLLSQPCIEIVRMSARCVRWLSALVERDDSALLELVTKTQTIVSHLVGGKQIPVLGTPSEAEGRKSLLEATRFPLCISWQPPQYRALSDRTYNFAAACNILPFSGWENEKFTSKLLKRRCGTDHFGLRVQGTKITGCLPATLEEDMKRQWLAFEELEPELPKTDFQDKLSLVKKSPWYKNEVEAKGGMPLVSTIAKYAEDDALSLFLGFSGLCLRVAGLGEAAETSLRYKQLALSVLLPICRFCLDETLWVMPRPKIAIPVRPRTKPVTNIRPRPPETAGKSIGEPEIERETTETTGNQGETGLVVDEMRAGANLEEIERPTSDKLDFEEWREEAGETIFESLVDESEQPRWSDNLETLVLDHNFPLVEEQRPPSPPHRRKRTRKVAKSPEKSDNWHRPSSGIVKKFVPVKCSELNQLWRDDSVPPTAHQTKLATSLMRKVHSCVRDLHGCSTFSAAEKNCLALSVALLDLAASPCCRDPFTCLQQASMYASQASKAGDSVLSFRRNIPNAHECTPSDALAILGRADCLHSVFFPEEAAFLCSFVARVSALHRSQASADGWKDRWKVVGMYGYNVSVMIRGTVSNMMNQTRPKKFSKMWEPPVVKELENGRKDARELLLSSTEGSQTGGQGDLENERNGGQKRGEGKGGSDQDHDDDGDGDGVSVQSVDSNESGNDNNDMLVEDALTNTTEQTLGDVPVYGI